MGHVEMTSVLDAPPETVFDFVCDIDRWPEWDAFAEEIVEASDRPLVAGSTYVERDGKDVSHWRVVEFDRPRRQVHVGKVPFLGEVVVEMDLQPTGDGRTSFHHVVRYAVMPRLRPAGWLVEKVYVDGYARRGMARTHADAKRLIATTPTG